MRASREAVSRRVHADPGVGDVSSRRGARRSDTPNDARVHDLGRGACVPCGIKINRQYTDSTQQLQHKGALSVSRNMSDLHVRSTVDTGKRKERTDSSSRSTTTCRSAPNVSPVRRSRAGGLVLRTVQVCIWSRSPCGPKIAMASTAPFTAPNQCGVHVENSTASPGLIAKSCAPSNSRNRPEST